MIMKVRSLVFGMLCMLALGAGFASCSDDDDDDRREDTGSQVELPRHRVFILNQGSWGYNNASIAFYAPNGDADFISDIFKKQNNAALGDNGQDLIEYEDRMYVAVNGSNYLAMLNAAGVEQKRVSFVGDKDLSAGIRYLAAEDGYIYASFYNGFIAKINANTLAVEARLGGLGDSLEGVAICDDVLYVANSYKQEGGAYIYNTNLVAVDLRTFTKKADLTVAINPNRLAEEEDRIFLLSKGDYANKPSSLQMIEPKNGNKITEFGEATVMCAANDMLYWVASTTEDWTHYTTTFHKYDIKSGQTSVINLAAQAPELATTNIGMIAVNDDNGDIYVGTASYTANGNIYHFKNNGTLVKKFDCGGLNPFAAVFFD